MAGAAGWRRTASIAGIAAGTVAAGIGALLAAEKIAVGRIWLRPDPLATEPLGQLHGQPLTVLADDGVPLYAEIDGRDDGPVTVVFCHGYCLSQDVWHFQRKGLSGETRLVLWDQRGHGRSAAGAADRATIDQTGADLLAVLRATAPNGPLVLVGHSMGGMTIMALALRHPELFGGPRCRVVGTVLICTAASGVDPAIWLPAPLRPVARYSARPLMRSAASGGAVGALEWTRNAAGDLAFLSTRAIAFGDGNVSPAVVEYLERIIRSTPVDVVARFYLALLAHDKRAALPGLGGSRSVVIAADRDRLVPLWQSERLVTGIPGGELVRAAGAGHAVILERPDLVNEVIAGLVSAAAKRPQTWRRA